MVYPITNMRDVLTVFFIININAFTPETRRLETL